VKGLLDFGVQWKIKGTNFPAWYQSDKWMAYALGGGMDVCLRKSVWLRADYEYQYWRTGWFNAYEFLNPQGVTLGIVYDFRHRSAGKKPHLQSE
jgi:opacity protein-like surface antigen